MGEAALPSEHLLITTAFDLPEFVQQSTRAKFPDAEVTFHKSVPGVKTPPGMFGNTTPEHLNSRQRNHR